MIELAPPAAAAKAAVVERTMFITGSRSASMRHAVSACTRGRSRGHADDLEQACHEEAHGPELGDGEELVGVGGKRHAEARRRPSGIDAPFAELSEVRHG